MTTAERAHGDVRSPIGRFIGIVAVFLIVGPPIGGIVVWTGTLAHELWQGRVVMPGAVGMFYLMILFSYPFGAPFAAACGIAHAVAAVWLRQSAILVPVAAAGVFGVAGVALMVWMYPQFGGPQSELKGVLAVILPAALIASLVCWYLTQPFARAA